MPKVFWFFLTAMLAVWLAMNVWTVPKIEDFSGGLRLLDMRLCYTADEARSFVSELGDEGRALYLGRQFWLDMVFPPLLAAVLFLLYRWLFPGRPGLVIGTLALTSIPVDYLENLAVAAMVRAGSDSITTEMATTASQWTTTKWTLAAVGGLCLVVGLVRRFRALRGSV